MCNILFFLFSNENTALGGWSGGSVLFVCLGQAWNSLGSPGWPQACSNLLDLAFSNFSDVTQ